MLAARLRRSRPAAAREVAGAAYFSKNWQATLGAGCVITVAAQMGAFATRHLPLDGSQTLFLNVSAVRNGWRYDIEVL
jgi:hypothetical protein